MQVVWTRLYEPWFAQRDAHVAQVLRGHGVAVEEYPGAVLYEPHVVDPLRCTESLTKGFASVRGARGGGEGETVARGGAGRGGAGAKPLAARGGAGAKPLAARGGAAAALPSAVGPGVCGPACASAGGGGGG
jgi:hypothetical protein